MSEHFFLVASVLFLSHLSVVHYTSLTAEDGEPHSLSLFPLCAALFVPHLALCRASPHAAEGRCALQRDLHSPQGTCAGASAPHGTLRAAGPTSQA